MKNIDPVDLNLQISQVKHIKDGGLLISYNDPDSAANFKCIATQKLSSDYKITELKKFYPKLRIVGLAEEYSSDVIARFFKGQNDIVPENCHLRVLKIWRTKKDPNIFQALVEVDPAVHRAVMERGKVFINYDVCKVYDATDVLICYKCSGFNHGQNACSSNTSVCPKCSLNHHLADCNSSNFNCINCTNAKANDTSHAVWDASHCPIYKRKLDQLKASAFITK